MANSVGPGSVGPAGQADQPSETQHEAAPELSQSIAHPPPLLLPDSPGEEKVLDSPVRGEEGEPQTSIVSEEEESARTTPEQDAAANLSWKERSELLAPGMDNLAALKDKLSDTACEVARKLKKSGCPPDQLAEAVRNDDTVHGLLEEHAAQISDLFVKNRQFTDRSGGEEDDMVALQGSAMMRTLLHLASTNAIIDGAISRA